VRVLADGQTHRLTDANRFDNLSHAICCSYGTDNKTFRRYSADVTCCRCTLVQTERVSARRAASTATSRVPTGRDCIRRTWSARGASHRAASAVSSSLYRRSLSPPRTSVTTRSSCASLVINCYTANNL